MSIETLASPYGAALLEPAPALMPSGDTDALRPVISIQTLSKRFASPEGSVDAVVDVSLDIARGSIFGIIGRSGAGKSTLVRCINLLERPTSGRVVVDGVDLVQLPPAELRRARRRVGMIFQHFNLLSSRTVYENVALPLELAGSSKRAIAERVRPLLDLVGLADLADRYPAQVSGGQKQRIGIARALANEPKVLLSDEATSALDPETTRSILALLADINRKLGVTIVLITHQMRVAQQICDRIAVMERGRVAEVGATLALFERPRSEAARTLVQDIVRQSSPRGPGSLARRFGRTNGGEAFGERSQAPDDFAVRGWLRHHGDALLARFDADTYRVLLDAMDTHDLARGRGPLEAVLAAIRQPTLVVSIPTDHLYVPADQQALVAGLPHAVLAELDSDHGHDGFLIDAEALEPIVRDFRPERASHARHVSGERELRRRVASG